MTATNYSQQVPSAERTLSLLEALAGARAGLSTAELMEAVESSRSGLYALLNTLKAREYVVSEDGRHRIGPAIWSLLPDRPRDLDTLLGAFAREGRPCPLDESMALTWPESDGGVVVAETQPDRPVRVIYRTGTHRSADQADGIVFAAGEQGDSPVLGEVRRRGAAATSSGEVQEIAVPVCADGVHPTAALIVGIPSHRATPSHVESLESSLHRLAARLSHRLGAAVYQPFGWAPTEAVGPTRELDPPELDEFLRGLWGAQLACVRSDGTPHLVPLWYEWDGQAMWLAASPGSSWRSHIGENPRVSVTLDEPWPPLRRLFLTGAAEEIDKADVPGGLEGLRKRLALRYLGRGAAQNPELSDTDGWAAIRIVPDRIHGREGLGPGGGSS